jgi:hypothetical protein
MLLLSALSDDGVYTISEAATLKVLLGPFHSHPDAALLAQRIADRSNRQVLYRPVHPDGRPCDDGRVFKPGES